MAQRIINIGSSANKGDGDPIRTAFGKVNDNFTELYGKVTVLEGQIVLVQDVKGDVFSSDSSKAYDSATGTFYGKFVGDLKGTIAADDSTILVDSVAGKLNATALTGALPAIDGSNLTGITTAFSNITSTPTTLAGYGITDAQAALVSGTNIKTVNGESLLGSGNLTISGGGGSAFTNIGVGADDSTIRSISEGESFLILGGSGITTSSDAEGNITIATDGALTGSSLEAAAVGAGVADGNDLAISGGDATELNSTGGDANITGGSGALAPGNVNIGTTQTTLVTIGSGSNNVDFPSGTAVDFTGVTITGTSFLTTVAFADLTSTPTTLGGYGITDAANTSTETTFTKDVHFDRGVEEKFQTLTGQSGVVIHNWNDGHVFYHTTPAGDITANFTNVNLTAEYATNVTIIINQGATPYEVTAVQIAGVAQTINWQGGSAPTGTANGIDSFSFTILNDGGSYVVLGQMVDFT